MRAGFVGTAGSSSDGRLPVWGRAGALVVRCIGFGPADVDDAYPESGIRREDAVISAAVDARWRDEAGEPLEELERS